MSHYVGLDVSLKETSVCVLDAEGAVVWRGQCRSEPAALAATVRKRAPEARRVVLESGTLSTWHELCMKLGDDGFQAAACSWFFIASSVSTPSRNLTPLMTLGN